MSAGPAAPPGPALAPAPAAVLLYDGDCGLCCRSVAFALRRSRPQDLSFAALSSPYAAAELARLGLPPDYRGSAVLLAGGRAYLNSDAILHLLRRLRWPWPLLSALRLAPRFLRDAIYRWVARNRLRFFGAADRCVLPRPGDAARFLVAPPPA